MNYSPEELFEIFKSVIDKLDEGCSSEEAIDSILGYEDIYSLGYEDISSLKLRRLLNNKFGIYAYITLNWGDNSEILEDICNRTPYNQLSWGEINDSSFLWFLKEKNLTYKDMISNKNIAENYLREIDTTPKKDSVWLGFIVNLSVSEYFRLRDLLKSNEDISDCSLVIPKNSYWGFVGGDWSSFFEALTGEEIKLPLSYIDEVIERKIIGSWGWRSELNKHLEGAGFPIHEKLPSESYILGITTEAALTEFIDDYLTCLEYGETDNFKIYDLDEEIDINDFLKSGKTVEEYAEFYIENEWDYDYYNDSIYAVRNDLINTLEGNGMIRKGDDEKFEEITDWLIDMIQNCPTEEELIEYINNKLAKNS